MTDEEDKARARRFIREEHMTRRQFEEEFPHQFANIYAPIFESEGLFFKGPEIGGKPVEGEGHPNFIPNTPRPRRRSTLEVFRLFINFKGQGLRRAQIRNTRYIRTSKGRIVKQRVSTARFSQFSKAERREMSKTR